MEIIAVIEGIDEAWIGAENNLITIGPEQPSLPQPTCRMVFAAPADTPMQANGVHASPTRITFWDEHAPTAGMPPGDILTS